MAERFANLGELFFGFKDRVDQDGAELLLEAAGVPLGTAFQSLHGIFRELAYEDLGHVK